MATTPKNAQGVGPETAVLARGWIDRVHRVQSAATNQRVGYCLDLPDLFMSKAAAGRDKDREFCMAMLAHRYVKHQEDGPSWSDARAKLAAFDRASLLGRVQDLYAASKDNQAFLHARLHLGDDVLTPYKATIDRWLWPDVFKNQDTSIAKAKKAIADDKKTSRSAEGQAELMVFYCERALGFSCNVGMNDEAYLSALVRMFEQALKTIATMPDEQGAPLWVRLEAVRDRCKLR